MNIKPFLKITVAVLTLSFGSCKTDFELNAPYEVVPVVYGFVDPAVDTQFVKINKSYLGDGDNFTYAPINDSTEFTNVSGTVTAVKNGVEIDSYPLQEMYVTDIDEGIFYSDSQKVYYWVPSSIDYDATYKIDVNINEGQYNVQAESGVVGIVNFSSLFRTKVTTPNGVSFANTTSIGSNSYSDLGVEWTSAENGKRYEVKLIFKFEEHRLDGTIYDRVISTTISRQTGQSNTNDFFQNYIGESFYTFIANRLQGNAEESDIEKRIFRALEFEVVVGDENLHTYMEVNEPASGIVTERPIFTNVVGGIGLFASRNTTFLNERNINGDPILLSLNSTRELVYGPITSSFKFCSDLYSDPFVICQ